MRALIALTILMGILIIAGTATLGVLIVRRLAVAPASLPAMTLDEPAGTHIVGMSAIGDRLAIRLEGGGPDRIIMIDPARGQMIGHIGLSH